MCQLSYKILDQLCGAKYRIQRSIKMVCIFLVSIIIWPQPSNIRIDELFHWIKYLKSKFEYDQERIVFLPLVKMFEQSLAINLILSSTIGIWHMSLLCGMHVSYYKPHLSDYIQSFLMSHSQGTWYIDRRDCIQSF